MGVLVAVIRILLPSRIRWIANNHMNGSLHFTQDALRVVHEHLDIERVARLMHLKGVRQHRPFEWHVLIGHARMVGVLDVDGGDVIGE